VNVAFLGLGNMGLPMAHNLLEAGHNLTVYNRTASRAEALGSGVPRANAPAEAVRGVEVAVTMLADDAAVEEVVFGAGSVLSALPAHAVHVSMSTISVGLARKLAAAHAEAGQGYVSAPVFGRPEAAGAAKLWVVAAGARDAIARCRPLFDAMGQGTFEVAEDPAAANVVKLAGNFMLAAMIETLGEAYALVRRAGVEPKSFLEIVNGALFKSPVYQNYGGIIADQRFEPAGFRLKLGLKDVRLALAAGEDEQVPLPLASLVRDHFLSALAHGEAERDWAALAMVSERAAGGKDS
jgi:3-hydroxyisobutyrate dehydrogenase-like beta-hydroxyacid dehydrogenase